MASYKPNYKKPNLNEKAVVSSVGKAAADIVQQKGYSVPTVPQNGQVKPQQTPAVKPQAPAAPQPPAATQQGYQGGYQKQLDDTMAKILNREDFSYDLNGDALWKQYQDQYTQKGKMAMMDTMGQAAAMTGGYGSSYGQTVGQQVYQGHLQEMNQMIPELYQLALQRYQMEGDQLMDQYGLIADQDDRAYGRYMDERDYQYQLGRDQIADQRYDQEWQYQQDRDKVADERYDKEWEYQVGRDQVADSRYDQEWQYQQDRDAIEDQRYQDQWEYEQSRDQIADERYDKEWEYQQGRDEIADSRYDQEWEYQQDRDAVADSQWQAEFDEDKRRYDQEWEYQQSRGSGGGGGDGSPGKEDSGPDFSGATPSQIRGEIGSCDSAAEARDYAQYLIDNGADPDLVWAAYNAKWGEKETAPAKGTNLKPPGKNSYVSLS